MSGRVTQTTGTPTPRCREAESVTMSMPHDPTTDPTLDPTIEENYDGLPGDFDTYEVIDAYTEDFAL